MDRRQSAEPSREPAAAARIMVVDDMATNRQLVKHALPSAEFAVVEAGDGQQALEMLAAQTFDLVLLDVMMPRLNGIEVCRRIRKMPEYALLPVIMLTTEDQPATMVEGMQAGATEYLTKPFHRDVLLARVKGAISHKRLTDLLDDAETVLFALARMVEAKDKTTGDHCDRLAHMGVVFGNCLGLDHQDLEALRRGGVLHDIGKLGIPDAILLKPAKLNEQEWALMKEHTNIGADLCGSLRSMQHTQAIIRHHHEKWDGSGYPHGLSGEQIPLLARVFQIVDVFDALTSARPYKPAWTVDKAIAMMQEETARGFWDPKLTAVFADIVLTTPEKLQLPANSRLEKSAQILKKIQATGVLDWLNGAKSANS